MKLKSAQEYAREAAAHYEESSDGQTGTVHGVAAKAQQAIAAAMLAELALKLGKQGVVDLR